MAVQTHWLALLHSAAAQFDGGARSFPLSCDAALAREYSYDPPNKDYQRLFSRQASVFSARRDKSLSRRSAGWLLPGEGSVCRPVFVAHSLLSAIWLLRETLAADALSSEGWSCLVRAAVSLSRQADGSNSSRNEGDEGEEENDEELHVPLSAQRPHSGSSPSPSPSLSPSPLQGRKRVGALLSHASESPKRARLRVVDGTAPASPALSAELSETDYSELEQHAQRNGSLVNAAAAAAAAATATVTTVTNHNRRAERERSKKLERKRAETRRELGLVEPDVKASRQERAAYASITQQDEPLVAWIIKQPISDKADFYTAARTPYYTATTLLERARTLGNHSARCHAAQFLQAWRERGSPFHQGAGGAGAGRGGSSGDGRLVGPANAAAARVKLLDLLHGRTSVDGAFSFAWDMCNRSEGELAAVHIQYRWAAALLGKAYVDKMAQLRHNDFTSSNDRSRNRYGKGLVRTEALVHLLKLVSPEPTERDRLVLRKRLARASRWYTIAQTLGWGSLALMPHDSIPNSWVESTLRTGELAVWMQCVKKETPDVFAASKALEAWLGPDAIAGGSIEGKETLSIEAQAPAAVYEIEEIQGSEDDDDEVGGGGTAGGTQIPPSSSSRSSSGGTTTSPSPFAAASPLRQMTLLELFHPV